MEGGGKDIHYYLLLSFDLGVEGRLFFLLRFDISATSEEIFSWAALLAARPPRLQQIHYVKVDYI